MRPRWSADTTSPPAAPAAEDPAAAQRRILRDLARKQVRFSRQIDDLPADLDLRILCRLFALHARSSQRLSRMIADREALTADAVDDFARAVAQALAQLGDQLSTRRRT